MTLVRSSVTTVRKLAIMQLLVQSHKTSFDLGDLFVGN